MREQGSNEPWVSRGHSPHSTGRRVRRRSSKRIPSRRKEGKRARNSRGFRSRSRSREPMTRKNHKKRRPNSVSASFSSISLSSFSSCSISSEDSSSSCSRTRSQSPLPPSSAVQYETCTAFPSPSLASGKELPPLHLCENRPWCFPGRDPLANGHSMDSYHHTSKGNTCTPPMEKGEKRRKEKTERMHRRHHERKTHRTGRTHHHRRYRFDSQSSCDSYASLSNSASSFSSSSSSPSVVRPSEDWVCEVCANINSFHRDQCFRCGVCFHKAHHPHSCVIQASQVPREFSKIELVNAFLQCIKGTSSPITSIHRPSGDKNDLETEVVLGAAWKDEMRMRSSHHRPSSHGKRKRMEGGSGHQESTFSGAKKYSEVTCDDSTSLPKASSPNDSFFFLLSSTENALSSLLSCHCQLRVVRRMVSDTAEEPVESHGHCASIPGAPSPPLSSSSLSVGEGSASEDQRTSITLRFSLSFASSPSRWEAVIKKRYLFTMEKTSVEEAIRSTAFIPTATTGSGIPTLSLSSSSTSIASSPVPSATLLLPASLEPSTWVAPSSFDNYEEEESYLNLLGDYWDLLSNAQKAFYNKTLSEALMRKLSSSAEEDVSGSPSTAGACSSCSPAPFTPAVRNSSEDPSSSLHPPPPSLMDGATRTSSSPVPYSVDRHRPSRETSTIQMVADPSSATLLAKVREISAKRKAAAKDANASSPPSGFPSPTMPMTSSRSSMATVSPSPIPRVLDSGSKTSSTLFMLTDSVGNASTASTITVLKTTSVEEAQASLGNGDIGYPPPEHHTSCLIKASNATSPCSFSTQCGNAADAPSGIPKASAQTLSCHSGFVFPPMSVPISLTLHSTEGSRRIVNHCILPQGETSSDLYGPSKKTTPLQTSYELTLPVSKRILNSSLLA